MSQELKTYVLIAGKHHKDGKTYTKGDKLELTESEAANLVNKIVDPASLGLSNDAVALQNRVTELEEKVQSLESENASLREQLSEFEEED